MLLAKILKIGVQIQNAVLLVKNLKHMSQGCYRNILNYSNMKLQQTESYVHLM